MKASCCYHLNNSKILFWNFENVKNSFDKFTSELKIHQSKNSFKNSETVTKNFLIRIYQNYKFWTFLKKFWNFEEKFISIFLENFFDIKNLYYKFIKSRMFQIFWNCKKINFLESSLVLFQWWLPIYDSSMGRNQVWKGC